MRRKKTGLISYRSEKKIKERAGEMRDIMGLKPTSKNECGAER